jgi:hypothetical protein
VEQPTEESSIGAEVPGDQPDSQFKTVSSWIRTARKIEATIGAFFAFLVGFVLLLGGFVLILPETSKEIWIWIPRIVWGAAIMAEGWFLYRLKTALESGLYPFAPRFALRFGRVPLLLRAPASLWWLAHFTLGIAGCVLVENLILVKAATWDVRLLRSLSFVIVSFTIAYSSNLYAMLAITSLGAGEKLVYRLWRLRFLLDFGVALVAVAFPFMKRTA